MNNFRRLRLCRRALLIVMLLFFSSGAAWGASDTGMAWMSLLIGTSTEEPATCDSSHLDLCTTESTCTGAGGHWWSDNTCNSTEEPATCDSSHLDLCTTESTCSGAGGYWWSDNTCELTSGTVTSASQVWMDRNLGASRVATSSTDSEAYGDLYQWGRGTDGHEKRDSSTTTTLSTTDTPDDGSFIIPTSLPNDWRNPQNDSLWQGTAGINNPCPSGFRLPTATELETEQASWSSNNSVGAYASPLKLVMAGYRSSDGVVSFADSYGYYWSSTVSGSGSRLVAFHSSSAYMSSKDRANGFSVRCFQD